MHANKATDVKVLLKTCDSLFSQALLSTLLAEEAKVAQTLPEVRLEGLRSFDLTKEALNVC